MAANAMFVRTALIGAALAAATVTAAVAQPSSSRDAVVTRTLPWTGGERLVLSVPADARYVQGPNARVVITGPRREIEHIVVDHGIIRQDRNGWSWGFFNWDWGASHAIRIVVTAPRVDDVGVSGSGHLDLGRLAQDRLDLGVSGSGLAEVSGRFKSLDLSVSGSGGARLGQVEAGQMSATISGSGWIRGAGAAGALELSISGSGHADLGGLSVQDATAHLSGSGSASLSPRRSADVETSGSGSIRLLTRPPQLSMHKSGSGHISTP